MFIQEVDLPKGAYDVLGLEAIKTIMDSLSEHHELPLQFSYLGPGAKRWDDAIAALSPEKQQDVLPDFTGVMQKLLQYIDDSPVELIDLGPGNGLQARDLLDQLLAKNQLQRYVEVDISKPMLDIAAKNLRSWCGDGFTIAAHVKDFINEPLDDIFKEKNGMSRIILVLGGTLDHSLSPVDALNHISQYVRPGDLLMYDVLAPTEASSHTVDFNLSPRHSFLLELLGITKDMYKARRTYDAHTNTRLDQIVPINDIDLTYKKENGFKPCIQLKQDEPITVWRYRSSTLEQATNNLRQSGLKVIAASTKDNKRQHLLLCEKSSSFS